MAEKPPNKESNKIRFRFIISICSITLLFIVYVVVAGQALYSQELNNSQNRLDLLGSQFEEQTKNYFNNYVSLVLSISELQLTQSKDTASLNAYFNRLNKRFKEFENIAAVDENGFFFASGQPFDLNDPPNVSKLLFFQNAKRGDAVFIMEPHVGPISHQNVTGVVIRLEDVNKQFKGLIGASIRLYHLTNKWAKFAEDKNLKLFCFRENNEILFSRGIAESKCELFLSDSSTKNIFKVNNKQYFFSNRRIEELNSNVVLLSGNHSSGFYKFVSTPINIAISTVFLCFISILFFMYRNEERYRQTVESSIDGFWITDTKGKFLQVNHAYCKMTGFSREELLGMSIKDVEAFESPEEIEKRIKDLIRFGSGKFETKQRCKNGTIIDLEVSATYAKNKYRRMFFVFLRNITDRKQAEEKLKKSESKLKKAQKIARLGQWELDLTTNSLHWSDEIFHIFDIDPDKFGASYEAFLDTIHPEDRGTVNKAYTDSLKNKTPYEISHRLLLKDGTVKFVNEICRTEYDEKGTPLLSTGIVQDITELKQAEVALSQETERLLVTLRSIGDGVITTDTKGRVTLINKIAEKLTGWSQSQAAGKDIKEVFNIINAETRQKCENPVENIADSFNSLLIFKTFLIGTPPLEKVRSWWVNF